MPAEGPVPLDERVQLGRFAPSTTGPAHPGTLLAALLCWLDCRSRGARVALRLEDLDPQRSSAALVAAMRHDLDWFGLDWDLVERQSEHGERHRAALERLAAVGLLYPCSCSRQRIRSAALAAADGGWIYPGWCRERSVPGPILESTEPLRCRMPAGCSTVPSEDGRCLDQELLAVMGDPVVRRRDGAVAYHLASIVDDAAIGVTRVVRGADLAPASATQAALRRQLDVSVPIHRHHALLLEKHGGKLAKFHGAVGVPELRGHYSATALCGLLAWCVDLLPEPHPCRPADLVAEFRWERVRSSDRVLRWCSPRLEAGP